jgi:hypothetical protein
MSDLRVAAVAVASLFLYVLSDRHSSMSSGKLYNIDKDLNLNEFI